MPNTTTTIQTDTQVSTPDDNQTLTLYALRPDIDAIFRELSQELLTIQKSCELKKLEELYLKFNQKYGRSFDFVRILKLFAVKNTLEANQQQTQAAQTKNSADPKIPQSFFAYTMAKYFILRHTFELSHNQPELSSIFLYDIMCGLSMYIQTIPSAVLHATNQKQHYFLAKLAQNLLLLRESCFKKSVTYDVELVILRLCAEAKNIHEFVNFLQIGMQKLDPQTNKTIETTAAKKSKKSKKNTTFQIDNFSLIFEHHYTKKLLEIESKISSVETLIKKPEEKIPAYLELFAEYVTLLEVALLRGAIDTHKLSATGNPQLMVYDDMNCKQLEDNHRCICLLLEKLASCIDHLQLKEQMAKFELYANKLIKVNQYYSECKNTRLSKNLQNSLDVISSINKKFAHIQAKWEIQQTNSLALSQEFIKPKQFARPISVKTDTAELEAIETSPAQSSKNKRKKAKAKQVINPQDIYRQEIVKLNVLKFQVRDGLMAKENKKVEHLIQELDKNLAQIGQQFSDNKSRAELAIHKLDILNLKFSHYQELIIRHPYFKFLSAENAFSKLASGNIVEQKTQLLKWITFAKKQMIEMQGILDKIEIHCLELPAHLLYLPPEEQEILANIQLWMVDITAEMRNLFIEFNDGVKKFLLDDNEAKEKRKEKLGADWKKGNPNSVHKILNHELNATLPLVNNNADSLDTINTTIVGQFPTIEHQEAETNPEQTTEKKLAQGDPKAQAADAGSSSTEVTISQTKPLTFFSRAKPENSKAKPTTSPAPQSSNFEPS